jgi:hypothetical protein
MSKASVNTEKRALKVLGLDKRKDMLMLLEMEVC